MKHQTMLSCFVLCLLGCSQLSLLRTATPRADDRAPELEELVDLGALPLPARGALSRDESDGVFTPGEWMAVLGKGIARPDVEVSIAGTRLTVTGYLEQGLIVRVPRGLSPRKAQVLRVRTPRGASERAFVYRSHVVVSDVSANRLRFLPMGAEAERLFLEPYDLELTRVRKHAFSPDGGLVYAVQAHAEADDGKYTLATIHAGAPEHPVLLGSVSVQLSAVPQDLLSAVEREQVWLLSRRELVVFDVSRPAQPRECARVELGEGSAWSLASLAGDTRAAVLEREQNLIWLYDMSGPTPVLVQRLNLEPLGMARASITLLSSKREPTTLWVLQGRSLGRFARRVNGLTGQAHAAIQRVKGVLGLGAPPAPADEAAEAEAEDAPAPPARVLAFTLAPTLRFERELPLPASVPLFLSMGRDGRLLVSIVSSDAAQLDALRAHPVDVRSLSSWLGGTLQFGRVLAIDPDGARAPESLVQGMAMFFEVDQLPDGQLVCSVMRLGVHGLIPGPGVDWKIEAPHLDSVGVRNLSWTFLLPPYVSPPVSLQ